MANGFEKIYGRNYWVNNTPPAINEVNLNNLENGVNTLDDRVVTLDKTKLDQITANTMVKDVTFDEATGIFTVTKLNGTTFNIDTKLEKIAVNFRFDTERQVLVIILDDGTEQEVDLSALITQYEFLDSDTITFVISSEGKVKAIIKNGSITDEMLEPNYLANITVQAGKAQTSANASAQSASDSAYDAKLSQSYAIGGSGIRTEEDTDNAKYYKEQASSYADSAKTSEINSKTSETNSKSSATLAETSKIAAKTSEANAKISETNAKTSEENAEASKNAAATSEENAKTSETNAENNADLSKSYAVGTGGVVRPNDDVDNAEYYYDQAKRISEGLSGGLLPMGTITFSQLASQTKIKGYMYNISDEFVTDETFKEGEGLTFPAGSNVYWTADGYWDVLAGSPVTGIKGDKETVFRRGNVNITPEDVGAVADNGDASNTTAKFSQASTRANIVSGEKLSVIFGKIMKWFADLKAVAFSGSYNDLIDAPEYTEVLEHIEEQLTTHGDDIASLKDNKVNIIDIVDDLESEDSFVPLSANMGRELSKLIYTIINSIKINTVTKVEFDSLPTQGQDFLIRMYRSEGGFYQLTIGSQDKVMLELYDGSNWIVVTSINKTWTHLGYARYGSPLAFPSTWNEMVVYATNGYYMSTINILKGAQTLHYLAGIDSNHVRFTISNNTFTIESSTLNGKSNTDATTGFTPSLSVYFR